MISDIDPFLLINKVFNLLTELGHQFQSTPPKPILNRKKLIEILKTQEVLNFNDIIGLDEIQQLYTNEQISQLAAFSQRITEVEKSCDKFAPYQDIMKKAAKTREDFLILFSERLTSLPLLVECAWVWACSYKQQEIKDVLEDEKETKEEETLKEDQEAFCPVVSQSGIARDIEDFMDLIAIFEKYKMNQVLVKELKACFDDNNTSKLSFLLAIFSEILSECEFTEDYCRDLSAGLCRVIKVDDTTPEGRILMEVKRMLSSILKMNWKSISKALKVYELLDLDKNQVDSLPSSYLEEDVTSPDELRKELNSLFPKEIISFPLKDSTGITHYDGNIALDSNYFEPPTGSKKIVKAMFTMLHELAHRKKFLNLAGKNIYYRTPPPVKSLYKDVDVLTTDDMLEKKAFGGHINIDRITKDIAEQLRNVEDLQETDWQRILEELIAENDQESTYFGGKKRNFKLPFLKKHAELGVF